jgi:hypothetical protein
MSRMENTRFMEAQEEYALTGNGKFLGEIYLIFKGIAAAYIKKYERGHGIRLNTEELAHDCASLVIRRYLDNPDFTINPNALQFYISKCCKNSLFQDKDWEMRKVSYDDWMAGTEGGSCYGEG